MRKPSEIILASGSPRRKELLQWIYPVFTVEPADIEETVPPSLPAREWPSYLARRKAASVLQKHPGALVIGADTLVLCDKTVMGKPRDGGEAFSMLKTLSGRKHQVVTGCAVLSQGRETVFSETTDVFFYPLSDREIEEYIATGDPFDKAGGYGAQSYGITLVRRIEGDFANVVGLPVARLKREIEKMESTENTKNAENSESTENMETAENTESTKTAENTKTEAGSDSDA